MCIVYVHVSFLHVASSRQSEIRDEKIKEMKEKYEAQLNGLKKELKHLEVAKRDHTIALKKNVSDSCVCPHYMYISHCTYMYMFLQY